MPYVKSGQCQLDMTISICDWQAKVASITLLPPPSPLMVTEPWKICSAHSTGPNLNHIHSFIHSFKLHSDVFRLYAVLGQKSSVTCLHTEYTKINKLEWKFSKQCSRGSVDLDVGKRLVCSFKELYNVTGATKSYYCRNNINPPERNNEIFSKSRNPLKYPIPYSRTKNISPSSTMPLPTSRTVCDLYFIVHCIFHIANCLLCILYRVFLLYPRHTAHFYMYICRILLIQLLGCHIEINACLANPKCTWSAPWWVHTLPSLTETSGHRCDPTDGNCS